MWTHCRAQLSQQSRKKSQQETSHDDDDLRADHAFRICERNIRAARVADCSNITASRGCGAILRSTSVHSYTNEFSRYFTNNNQLRRTIRSNDILPASSKYKFQVGRSASRPCTGAVVPHHRCHGRTLKVSRARESYASQNHGPSSALSDGYHPSAPEGCTSAVPSGELSQYLSSAPFHDWMERHQWRNRSGTSAAQQAVEVPCECCQTASKQ